MRFSRGCCVLAGERLGGRRAAEEYDEVAPSHANPPVEDKAYERVSVVRHSKIAPAVDAVGHVWTGAPGDRRKVDGASPSR